MYDADNIQNSILKMPGFYTSASHFSRNGHDTAGNVDKQKLTTTELFRVIVAVFLPIPCLKYLPNIISGKITVKETSGVHFIHPKVRFWVAVK